MFSIVSFDALKFFNFDEVQFLNFSFIACTLGVISKKQLPNPRSRRFIHAFY